MRRTKNIRLHAQSKHLIGSYHQQQGRVLEVCHQHFSHEHVWPQHNHKHWNSEPNLVISSPCISGIYLWYWSLSLQRMTKASLFSNWALCSYSCSRLEKMLKEPLWAMDTRPAGLYFSSELMCTKTFYWIKLTLLNQCMPPLILSATRMQCDIQQVAIQTCREVVRITCLTDDRCLLSIHQIFVFWFPCTCANGLSKWLIIRAILQV